LITGLAFLYLVLVAGCCSWKRYSMLYVPFVNTPLPESLRK